jgi:hypothetical protein
MWWRSAKQPKPAHTVKTPYRDIFEFLVAEKHLPAVVTALGSCVHDLFALARVNKATWEALAGDHKLWRGVYLQTDPLITPDIR